MKPNFLLLAAVGTLLSFNFLNAQTVVTSDFTTVADGRVQSSGMLGLELAWSFLPLRKTFAR